MAGELLGGEDRIDKTLFESCGDSLIVNLGSEEWVNVRVSSATPEVRTNLDLGRKQSSRKILATGTCGSIFNLFTFEF